MTIVNVGDEFEFSIIDKESVWKEILNYIKNIDGEVKLVFDFVVCYNPFRFNSFKQLYTDERVYMEFISSEPETSTELANNLKISCIMDGYKEDRFVGNLYKIKKPDVVSSMTAITERLAGKLKDSATYNEEENCYVISYDDLFGQLDNTNTIPSIFKAAYDLYKETEVSEYTIILGDYIFSSELLDSIAKNVVSFKNELNITINIGLDDEDSITNYNSSLYRYNSTELSIYRKFEEFKKLKYDLAGILIKYKHSRAVDTLGRESKGKQASSRVSIYRGIATLKGYEKKVELIPKDKLDRYTVKEDKIYNELGVVVNPLSLNIIIQDLKLDYFNTKAHFECSDEEVDIQLDEELPFSTQKIPITHIGLYDKFVGRCFHFLKPWQESIDESENIIEGFNNDGFIEHKDVTVPEKMKIVFDDWEVIYNEEELDKSIQLNNEYLMKKFGKLYN